MSAAEHLNGVQFMGVEDLRKVRAGDFPGSRVGSQAHIRRWKADANAEPQGRHRDHGGPQGYVDHLAESIAAEGMHQPIEIATWTNTLGEKRDYLSEGHHRALAALQAGLARVPYVHRGEQTGPWG